MKLLTAEILKKMPKLGATSRMKADKIPIIAKFFDPSGSYTFYATEGEEQDGDYIMFGYVTGLSDDELGYVSMNELKSVRTRFGLGIERDLHFDGKMLSDVMKK